MRGKIKKGLKSIELADMSELIPEGFHSGASIVDEQMKTEFEFAAKGIVKNKNGEVVGTWINGRKGKKYAYMLKNPIAPDPTKFKTELKDVTVDGKTYKGVEVKVFSAADSAMNWRRGRRG